ncbi:MAG: serine/threonine-protein kinase [Polyangiaceae bacterium]
MPPEAPRRRSVPPPLPAEAITKKNPIPSLGEVVTKKNPIPAVEDVVTAKNPIPSLAYSATLPDLRDAAKPSVEASAAPVSKSAPPPRAALAAEVTDFLVRESLTNVEALARSTAHSEVTPHTGRIVLLPADSQLGKYHLVAELARGGMGTIYLALANGPAGFQKLVVVKELRLEDLPPPYGVGMFMEEARLAARLNHPNVVQTYEVGSIDDRHFLAMEYLEGQSLFSILSQSERMGVRLPLGVHLRIICDALSGLHYAHELADYDGVALDVVHRDVSPQNVFVTYEGQVKMLDFGIAKTALSPNQTGDGMVRGRLSYMPPEQFRSEKVDRTADLFSIGVMIWEAAAKQRLWEGMPDLAIIRALTANDVPFRIPEGFPAGLVPIVEKAMSVDPSKRHATARELQSELESFLATHERGSATRDVATEVRTIFARERSIVERAIATRLRDVTTSLAALHSEPDFGGGRAEDSIVPIIAPSSLAPEPSAFLDRRRTWTMPLVAAVATALGVAAGALLYMNLSRPSVAPLAAAPKVLVVETTAPTPAPVPPPSATADVVELSLRASPESARILLDGKPLPSNPYSATFSKDETDHVVVVEAPGYETAQEVVRLSKDATLVLNLVKSNDPRPVFRVPGKPVPTAKKPGDVGVRGVIDPQNPYE